MSSFLLKGTNNILTISDNHSISVSEMAKHSVIKNDGKCNTLGHKHFNSLEVDDLRVRPINGIQI